MSTSNKVCQSTGVREGGGGCTGRVLFHETKWKSRGLRGQFLRTNPSQLDWNNSDDEEASRILEPTGVRAPRRRSRRPLLRCTRSAGADRRQAAVADGGRRFCASSQRS